MDNIYLIMIIALAVLAIADLIVGVSNDAVNFLNSAIGSKAISFKTIMIVASIGVAVGAMTSSGMMEVARKGIFNPSFFSYADVMGVFMAAGAAAGVYYGSKFGGNLLKGKPEIIADLGFMTLAEKKEYIQTNLIY